MAGGQARRGRVRGSPRAFDREALLWFRANPCSRGSASEVVMAVDISDRYKRKLKLPNYADLHARIKLRSLVERHRTRRREKLNTAIPARTLAHPCQITDALEAAAPHFLEHGW